MEPLFTAKSQFTWEECWQMTKTALLRRRHTALAVVALVLLCILFLAVYMLVVRINTRRAFLANRVMRDQNMSFSFYADRFEVEYGGGHAVIPFDQLFALWETDTNFYLMLSPNQGYALSREGCNEDLAAFLRTKNAKKI